MDIWPNFMIQIMWILKKIVTNTIFNPSDDVRFYNKHDKDKRATEWK